jgi:ElaB/YqjD/DUF883 family membrane-anchored ribosome-binding protein
MKTLDKSLILLFALGLSAGCAQPQDDDVDLDEGTPSTEEIGQAVEETSQEFATEAREAMNELGTAFQELETTNANLQGESAAAWAEAREEITQARQELQSDLDRVGTASAEESQQIRARIADNLERMTHRVERAKLVGADGSEEFVSAAQERLAEIDQDIQSLQSEAAQLPMETREQASQTVESLRSEANDVRETLMSMADAAPQEIAEQRDQIADEVATLSASVRRETFEMQADLES